MAASLETVLAELAIKDLSTGSLKKIEAALERTKSQLKNLESQTGKTGGVFNRLGEMAKKTGSAINEYMKKPASAGAQVASVLASGQSMTGMAVTLAADIPYLGKALTATVGVLSSSLNTLENIKTENQAAVNLLTDINIENYRFGQLYSKKTMSLKDELTQARDFKRVSTAIADLGVKPETFEKYSKTLESFRKAGGFKSLGEAAQSLVSGKIPAGVFKGPGAIEKTLEAKAYASLLGNVASADEGFKGIARILEKNQAEMDKSIKSLNTGSLKAANHAAEFDETFIIAGAANTDYKNLMRARVAQVGKRDIEGAISSAILSGGFAALGGLKSAGAAVKGFFTGSNPTPPSVGHATGGPVFANKPSIVGEKGPEIFNPGRSGSITPMQQSSPNVNFNIQITVPFNSIGMQLNQEVRKALEHFSRGAFRINTGLPLTY